MAIGWIAAFKAVPWAKVLHAAPSIVDGGRSLWASVASRRRGGAAEVTPAAGAGSPSEIEVRLRTLELRNRQLEEEAVASFDVVRSITEQHSRLAEQQALLVQATDVLLARTRFLLWLFGALVLAAIGLLVYVLSR